MSLGNPPLWVGLWLYTSLSWKTSGERLGLGCPRFGCPREKLIGNLTFIQHQERAWLIQQHAPSFHQNLAKYYLLVVFQSAGVLAFQSAGVSIRKIVIDLGLFDTASPLARCWFPRISPDCHRHETFFFTTCKGTRRMTYPISRSYGFQAVVRKVS